MQRLISYFFSGLLIVVPLTATIFLLAYIVGKIDSLIEMSIPGVGFLIVISALTFIGYIGSGFIARPILRFIDTVLVRTPVINIVYSSIKDLIEAFVGDKRKFDHPVLVDIDGNQTYRVGFLTQKDGSVVGLPNHVGVYVPHSYNFSGNFFIVPKERLKELRHHPGRVMRFTVSGGVVDLEGGQVPMDAELQTISD